MLRHLVSSLLLLAHVGATILQNGQVKITNYPSTQVNPALYSFTSYANNAPELSYKGRWDDDKVSYWSAPGLKFGFTGNTVAITFGTQTIANTLVGFRFNGLDWKFTNVTGGATHLFANDDTALGNANFPVNPSTFEMRVTNWAYGVQINQVHVGAGQQLIKIPDFKRKVEFIGDSLSSGMYTSYEGLSSFAYATGAGLGDTEFSVTSYPGVCVADQDCWGNPRGQSHQWFYTADTGWRALQKFGDNPIPYNFTATTPADLVVINLGTNDANAHNNVKPDDYVEAYKRLIAGIHGVWPSAQVIIMSMWQGFSAYGNSYTQSTMLKKEVTEVYKFFNSPHYLDEPWIWDATQNMTTQLVRPSAPFVHLFDTTGILQHNDIAPQWHPTDVGAIKVAAHLIRYINIKFGWDLYATGPEVLHDTLYWNDESGY